MERSSATFKWDNPPFPAETDGFAENCGGESIEELARRVLFSEDLDEKLRLAGIPSLPEDPETDSAARDAGTLDGVIPARPVHLRFARDSASRPSLPGRAGLVDETNRGVLLHFFANHELLAAELMALALLKFPEAPAAFRHGLARTLREEQRHTRWYVNRMRECGVDFGSYPLSGFFWEAVSQMECPMDYVSRLSLTFEQANLDYSLHYGQMLGEVGDARSASILLRIYEDEISHVGYGLRWFRRWKNESQSDWSALKRRLPFPLSPSRAKGNRAPFNREGRRAAGFDEDYIERLALFERSRGRTPNVFYFNPEAEHRAAAWPKTYHAKRKVIAIARDLELLAAFLARKDDVLLVRRLPSNSHLAKLRHCGLQLPELELLNDSGELSPENLILQRKVNSLQPWAIAPNLAGFFGGISPTSAAAQAKTQWSAQHRDLFSKKEQIAALTKWTGLSYPCKSPADLSGAIARLEEEGFPEAVLKRAFSTAGSGMVRLPLRDRQTLKNRPLSPRILSEGGILLEPHHDRVFDFSVQYRIESGRARLVGFVEQMISSSGGYRGSLCQNKFCKGLDADLARFLMTEVLPLYREDGELAGDLVAWADRCGYEGPLGVDAYLYRGTKGELALRAICEVNPRHTMGLVALGLKRQVAPGTGVRFEIVKACDLTEDDDRPVLDAEGRFCGGSLVLTERDEKSAFAAKITLAADLRSPHSPHGDALSI